MAPSGIAGTVITREALKTMAIGLKAAEVLEMRGLDLELLARLGVDGSTQLGGDRCGAIRWPIVEGGNVVGWKHRTLIGEKRFVQDKGTPQIFYNVDALRDDTLKAEPIVITEGELDCWAAIQAGYHRCVSVPNGAPLERIKDDDGKKYRYVEEALSLIGDAPHLRIVLAVDSDNQGNNLRADLALRLGSHRCWFLRYPKPADGFDHCKDLCDVLQQWELRGITVTMNRARLMQIEGYAELADLPELSEPRSYTTGMTGMDRHWKLRLGDTSVITGIPGHGKSSFINEVCCRMAKVHGWRTVFASFEQTPQTDHRRALRSFFAEQLEVDMSNETKRRADEWINAQFGFIVPQDDVDVTLEWFLATAKAAVLRKEAQILVVDPWNQMDHTRPPDMSQTEYVGFAIKSFTKFAKRLNIHLIVAAHPAKMQRMKSGKYPVPTLYDISDSAHWSNRPDVGIVIHREDLKVNKTLISIVKARYHTIGIPGDLYGAWKLESSRYQITDDGKLL